MTRIAYVCADPGVPVYGRKGSSVHVQSVIAALLRRGVRVELLAARVDGDPPPALGQVPVHRLPYPAKGGDRERREREGIAANGALRAALDALGRVDGVYERYSLWSHAGMEFAASAGVPGILEVNAPLVREQVEHRGLVLRAQADAVARRVTAAASALVAVSDGVAAFLRDELGGADRVHVVPNGVDPERFPAPVLRERTRAPRPFTVGFVGTLKPWHGLPTLVDAFALLQRSTPGARLRIVGDGPERATLERAIADRGIAGATTLTGAVEPVDVPAELARIDVATAPYPPLDPFYFSPLKVVEAMACGLPVVASRVGALPELVRDGSNGILVAPGEPVALAAALRRLEGDRRLRRRLGRAARAHVLAHHTWDAVGARVLELAGLQRCPHRAPTATAV